MKSIAPLVSVAGLLLCVTPAEAVRDVQAQRIRIAYEKPTNPAHQSLYELLQERKVLEKLQEIFSPFRLPQDLTFKTVGCDGLSNAWYHRPTITLCYEYLDEIKSSVPKETTPAGITPSDALVGQFFYVVAHEFGHAVFDLLQLPSFGRFEDIADQFSTYMMLHFGQDQARRLISGAAYSYKSVLQSPMAFVPLKAFSDVHGLPAQRFFNLLCLAYGADPDGFAVVAEEKYLPKERIPDCAREYAQVAYAFQQLIGPYVDQELAKKVMQKSWLPPPSAPTHAR
jgi:hypothetical protein